MPKVHRGCRGLATAKKESIVIKLIRKELCPFMEIIERHHTRRQEKCYDLKDLCRKYRVTDEFEGRSSIPGIQIISGCTRLPVLECAWWQGLTPLPSLTQNCWRWIWWNDTWINAALAWLKGWHFLSWWPWSMLFPWAWCALKDCDGGGPQGQKWGYGGVPLPSQLPHSWGTEQSERSSRTPDQWNTDETRRYATGCAGY